MTKQEVLDKYGIKGDYIPPEIEIIEMKNGEALRGSQDPTNPTTPTSPIETPDLP